MATWTQADVDKLRTAIVALATGEAVQQVRYDGPPARSVTYHPMDLDKMRALLASMETSVAATTRARFTYIATKDGF
jgi:hypothetical protein